MTILPLLYLGNTEYYSLLHSDDDVVIDMGENYVKQSYRNRCEILTAGGVGMLTVNVVKGGSINKKPVMDMRIDYSKRWQHQHAVSLLSAYKNSPYFDHYREYFEPFYAKKYEFLADFNVDLLMLTLKLLRSEASPRFSETYVEAVASDTDMRSAFEPLKRGPHGEILNKGTAYGATPYCQVFSDRLPFVPNLSVADLLFCEGPCAISAISSGERR